MMPTPCGPSAVPTGGAGVALPAGIWILMIAATFFFAIAVLLSGLRLWGDGDDPGPGRGRTEVLELGDLAEVHLHRGLTTEDVDQHLELHVIGVDLRDLAV